MPNSSKTLAPAKPRKPRASFPLFVHQSGGGRWCKKVRGRFVYFGKVADDPKGEAALKLWLEQRDDLLAGRTPRTSKDGLTVHEACNRFLAAKEAQRNAGDITPRSFADYFATCKRLIDSFGKARLVDDLAADDFERLRASLAKQYGVHRLGNEVQRTRVVFKYAYDAGLIDRPMRFGPTFKRPSTRIMRASRQAKGPRMFEPEELRALIDAAEQPLKSMVLLALNTGFGNADCGALPMSSVDLRSGWLDFPRPKTSVARKCPLWPETGEELRQWLAERPAPKSPDDARLVFITKYGAAWSKDTSTNPISQQFRKLLNKLGLHKPGKGFYTLRHVFQTIADEARDPVATRFLMGHTDSSMSGVYRERISDDRLRAVVAHVHDWLFSVE